MKILLVEDEDRSARQTLNSIARVSPTSTVYVAASRDMALRLIESDDFDLIICDVKIPPTDASADLNERHGLAVQAAARSICPGTPTIFLTAFATAVDVRRELSSGGLGEIFAERSYPLTQLIRKDEVEELESVIANLHTSEMDLVSRCSLVGDLRPDDMLGRAVRMYAVATDHHAAEPSMTEGLSGARTARVILRSASMAPASIFVKVLPHRDADEELDRFNRYVPNRLAPGYFAPALQPISTGLRKQTALLSTLAESGSVPLFELMTIDADRASSAVDQLRDALASWRTNDTVQLTVGDLRRRHISDAQLEHFGIDVDEFRDYEQQVVECGAAITHGDLHGDNILVGSQERPMLIDFGDVGPGYAATDPIVLETSLVFHPNGPLRGTEKFVSLDWGRWLDLEHLCADNPFAPILRATRLWSELVETESARCAIYYAHCLRQIKYGEIPQSNLLEFARAVSHVA